MVWDNLANSDFVEALLTLLKMQDTDITQTDTQADMRNLQGVPEYTTSWILAFILIKTQLMVILKK